mmetsp:Transcript_9439/g.21286  ORF Transcript_9439/g.21286 Transcript_9439/m.21286 type:complete len:99 (+) Transcript_9439:24-320(+)|eukprot:CAMPEP_0172302306 /NCGR_PEP_ID=MMETSP1058-20130122/4030_1 /TAXON_ID=83371 /ORGANISM="Detonula confervacea, Strain CCMP 353" /LENGTH=98 /DNA_ID=CAMNT_0013012731 /DNA_START=11 /DNA_END=307 /DNA_ORIENTATION=+
MQTILTNPNNDEGESTTATDVAPTACELQCSSQQKALVACVDSIRAARSSDDGASTSGNESSTTATDAPDCMLTAVQAWTKCCEEANVREEEERKASP